MDDAKRLGTLLGIIARESMPVVQEAIRACSVGEGTPKQQKLVVEILETTR